MEGKMECFGLNTINGKWGLGGVSGPLLLLHSYNGQSCHHCCTFLMIELAIIVVFLKWQESFFFKFITFKACLGFCVLLFWVQPFVLYGPLFASSIDSRCSLPALPWPLHFKQPFKACQKCSPSHQLHLLGQLGCFVFADVFPSCVPPWFYPPCFLGLVLGSI